MVTTIVGRWDRRHDQRLRDGGRRLTRAPLPAPCRVQRCCKPQCPTHPTGRRGHRPHQTHPTAIARSLDMARLLLYPWHLSHVVLPLRVATKLELEEIEHELLPTPARMMQRRIALAIGLIHRGARAHQEADELAVAVEGGTVQRRVPVLVGCVRVGPEPQQLTAHLQRRLLLLGLRGQVERRHTARRRAINLSTPSRSWRHWRRWRRWRRWWP
mmetsp:Transcript_59937/g.164289  ORF Transcript_59937/g.164289 Transcript_59937/m.164289 type:complete len:214 (-) Transcript_59937:1169-1810(-)